jgi:uncharacterized membrane protein
MLKTAKTALFTLVALLVPVLAFAQDAAPEATEVPAEDFGELVNMMISAAKGGEWSLFVAALIMVLVFLATKIKFIDNLLPAAAKPWVAAVAGVLGAVATVAMTTGDWLQAVLSGLVTGAAASGLWELIGKRILKKDAPAEEPATTEGA